MAVTIWCPITACHFPLTFIVPWHEVCLLSLLSWDRWPRIPGLPAPTSHAMIMVCTTMLGLYHSEAWTYGFVNAKHALYHLSSALIFFLHFLKIYLFIYLCMWVYVCVWVCGYICMDMHRGPERMSDPSELELQATVSHLMWIWGFELQSSTRAMRVLQLS